MDISIGSLGINANMRVREDTSVEVRGYPHEAKVCPAFVSLTLVEGKYPNRQEFNANFDVDRATQLRDMLSEAIIKAGG